MPMYHPLPDSFVELRSQLPNGMYWCGKGRGWVEITGPDTWWTTGKNTHFALDRAVCITLQGNGHCVVMYSLLSMHIEFNANEAQRFIAFLELKLRAAIRRQRELEQWGHEGQPHGQWTGSVALAVMAASIGFVLACLAWAM